MLTIIREGRAQKNGVISVGSYARVSTDKDDQRNSLASQRSYFVEMIGREPGLSLYGEYFDEGISGTSLKKRDAFNRMLADALAGKLEVIVTKEVSRFARNTVDVLSITRELRQQGVQVIFLNDGINTFSGDGELRLSLMASLAQEESRKTSERVKWGQTRRMEQGVVFGRSMLGYDVKDGKITINPAGAEVVRLIYHKYLNESLGAFRIARDLESAGIPTYHGDSRWTPKVIYSILRNEKYVGDLEQKKTYTPNYLSHDKKYNHGAESKVLIQNHHEPVIDREIWTMVQAEIQRRGELVTRARRSKHSNKYWCSGKLRCAECGSYWMRRVRALGNGGERRSWCCSEAVRFGARKLGTGGKPIGCNTNAINEQALQYCVQYCVQQVQFDYDRLVEEMLAEMKAVQRERSPYDVARLEKEIQKQEEKRARAIDLRLAGEIDSEELGRIRQASERETARLREKLCEAKDFEHQQGEQPRLVAEYTQKIRAILGGECTTQSDSEAFLGQMLEHALVYEKGEVEIKLQAVPFSLRLRYVTGGRGESYTVKVSHWEQVWQN